MYFLRIYLALLRVTSPVFESKQSTQPSNYPKITLHRDKLLEYIQPKQIQNRSTPHPNNINNINQVESSSFSEAGHFFLYFKLFFNNLACLACASLVFKSKQSTQPSN